MVGDGDVLDPPRGLSSAISPSEEVEGEQISTLPDEGRSSSLSELEEGPEDVEMSLAEPVSLSRVDRDSEAETERLNDSPSKSQTRHGQSHEILGLNGSHDQIQLIAHPETVPDTTLSDITVSTPRSSAADPESDLASVQSAGSEAEKVDDPGGEQIPSLRKRNFKVIEKNDHSERGSQTSLYSNTLAHPVEDNSAARHISLNDNAINDMLESETGGKDAQKNRSELLEDESEVTVAKSSKVAKLKHSKPEEKTLLKNIVEQNEGADVLVDTGGEDVSPGSNDEDCLDGDDEDTEAIVKNDDEYAKKMAAVDSLAVLERHFAVLRDRLYDERIVGLNEEIALLSTAKPCHPGYIRQLESIRRYRDDKYESEQKLLVYKIKSLKAKSVAHRSQIHSAYFQTIRDVREKHLDRVGERLSRLRRDHAKIDTDVPAYSIPYPRRRWAQINQQSAYNKEVSILSGIAKYIGFPAAPALAAAPQVEVEEDMQKIGIPTHRSKSQKEIQSHFPRSSISAAMAQTTADEQFLERNPWANPQHPAHQQRMGGLSRQVSDQTQVLEAETGATIDAVPSVHKGSIEPSQMITATSNNAATRSLGLDRSTTASPLANTHNIYQSNAKRRQINLQESAGLSEHEQRSASLSPTAIKKKATHHARDIGPNNVYNAKNTTNTTPGEVDSQYRQSNGGNKLGSKNFFENLFYEGRDYRVHQVGNSAVGLGSQQQELKLAPAQVGSN